MPSRNDQAATGDESSDNTSQRDSILRSTLLVALDRGFGKVTIEAVAQRAGVSKGGLLYHFPNKFCLIEALLERFVLRITPADPNGSDARQISLLIAAAECPTLIAGLAEKLGQTQGDNSDLSRRWRLCQSVLFGAD